MPRSSDAAASAAITPGLRRLLRGLIERNRAEARRDAGRIARVEAALDAGTPLDRDEPEDRAAADAHYEAVAPVWRRLDPKARLALVLPYVQSLGLLPKGLVRRLDAALRGTPQDKHGSAGLIGAIARDMIIAANGASPRSPTDRTHQPRGSSLCARRNQCTPPEAAKTSQLAISSMPPTGASAARPPSAAQ